MSEKNKSAHLTKILPLTSARFFAAIYVVVYHTIEFSGIRTPDYVNRFISLGETSVSFFFILSGYILASVYLSRAGHSINNRRFWWARFARIYPIYIVMVLCDAPYLFIDRLGTYGVKQALVKTGITLSANIGLLQAWLFGKLAGINNPSWSLSVEAFFYLIFPFIGVRLWKMSRRRTVLLAVLIYLLYLALVLELERNHFGKNWWYYLPPMRVSEFIIGIAAAKLHVEIRAGKVKKDSMSKISLVTFIAAMVCFIAVFNSQLDFTRALPQTILFVPLHVIVILSLASEPKGIRVLASHPLLVLLGEASYGLYIIHIPLWHLFGRLGWSREPALYALFLGVAIGLSVASFLYLETPVRLMILRSVDTKDAEGVIPSSMAQ